MLRQAIGILTSNNLEHRIFVRAAVLRAVCRFWSTACRHSVAYRASFGGRTDSNPLRPHWRCFFQRGRCHLLNSAITAWRENCFARCELRWVRWQGAASQAYPVDTPRFGDAVSGPISRKQTTNEFSRRAAKSCRGRLYQLGNRAPVGKIRSAVVGGGPVVWPRSSHARYEVNLSGCPAALPSEASAKTRSKAARPSSRES